MERSIAAVGTSSPLLPQASSPEPLAPKLYPLDSDLRTPHFFKTYYRPSIHAADAVRTTTESRATRSGRYYCLLSSWRCRNYIADESA